MALLDILGWLGAIAGGLLSLVVIWTKGIRPLWRFLRRVEAVHELITDELPEFMTDMREWRSTTEDSLKRIEAQLTQDAR